MLSVNSAPLRAIGNEMLLIGVLFAVLLSVLAALWLATDLSVDYVRRNFNDVNSAFFAMDILLLSLLICAGARAFAAMAEKA
jgi:hypothetical protein